MKFIFYSYSNGKHKFDKYIWRCIFFGGGGGGGVVRGG